MGCLPSNRGAGFRPLGGQQHPIFGLGGFAILEVSTPAVVAYLRTPHETGDGTRPVLCVANFSGSAQPAELNLARARLNELLSVVTLYRSLGGGWQAGNTLVQK